MCLSPPRMRQRFLVCVISCERYQLLSLLHLWPCGCRFRGKVDENRVQKLVTAEAVCADITWTGAILISQSKHTIKAGDQTKVTSDYVLKPWGKNLRNWEQWERRRAERRKSEGNTKSFQRAKKWKKLKYLSECFPVFGFSARIIAQIQSHAEQVNHCDFTPCLLLFPEILFGARKWLP